MAVNSITLTGWKEFEKKALDMTKLLPKEMNIAARTAAQTWEQLADRDAPIDFGGLRQGISSHKISDGNWEVVSSKNYSAFMEWGTKSHVSVPADLTDYAMQFKGTGTGDYFEFLNNILDWVKRHGLARITNSYTGKSRTSKNDLILVAQTIAFFIMKYGVRPHPFFFKQKPIAESQLLEDLEQMINTPR